jgi:hypothetical protein
MTLNSSVSGAYLLPPRGRLQGPDRGLDAFVGLVILLAELAIGALSVTALYAAGIATNGTASDPSAVEAGFAIALFGGGFVVIVTTLIYLVRVVAGRRSWPAPLWGLILMTVALFVGYLVMAAGA